MYNKVVVLTNMKYIPAIVLVELARMYSYVCVSYINTSEDIKANLDAAYTNNKYFEPVPVYVCTSIELMDVTKIKLRKYCNSLGVTDVVFKVHI